MICPECVAAGLRSSVTPGMSTTTAMYYAPFWDEDGVYHVHDGNRRATRYRCSNGHSWVHVNERHCPGCAWPDTDKS